MVAFGLVVILCILCIWYEDEHDEKIRAKTPPRWWATVYGKAYPGDCWSIEKLQHYPPRWPRDERSPRWKFFCGPLTALEAHDLAFGMVDITSNLRPGATYRIRGGVDNTVIWICPPDLCKILY